MSITRTVIDAAVGGDLAGGGVSLESKSTSYTTDTASVTGRYRGELGFGYLGQRMFGRTYPYSPYERSAVGGGGFATISITSTSGALLGNIRTDIQKPIVESLEFTLDERGCADFKLTLNSLPDFPFLPISIISVNIGNSDFNWYTGILETAPDDGTPRDKYVYSGFGLRKQLQRVAHETTYSAPQDVGLIVQDLVQNFVSVQTSINYNASKIDTTTGVLIASTNDISEADLEKVFDMYANMANARWGVDGDGDFYFELKTNTIKRNWIVGYDLQDFQPDRNINDIRNSIIVQRQSGKGSGGAGWAIAYTVQDATSQAKYGLQELKYQMPGYFSDADCQLVGDTLLAEKKDPKYYAKVKDIPVTSVDNYIERGVHRFVNTPSRYDILAQECDDETEWTVTAASGQDLVLTDDTATLVTGAGSIQMDWTDATNATISAAITARGGIKKIKCWLRSNRTGLLLSIGVGNGSFTQNERSISFDVASQWFMFDWDVSDLNLTTLNEVGFTVLNSTAATTINIDSILIETVGSRHYSLELTRSTYQFSPDKQAVSVAEFGPPPERMYDYISSLLAQAAENQFTGQQR